jgi:hypothetical protein
MRIIDFSLALAEPEQTAEPTLRQHPEVDTKDNLRAARLPLVFITERGSKTRKKGVMFELPQGSVRLGKIVEGLTHEFLNLHRRPVPHFSRPLREVGPLTLIVERALLPACL